MCLEAKKNTFSEIMILDKHTWLIRPILAITVVIIYSVKGNSEGSIQACKRFALFIKLSFCKNKQVNMASN